jgi:hypothetical protein
MMASRSWAFVVAGSVSLVVSACGDDSTPGSSASSSDGGDTTTQGTTMVVDPTTSGASESGSGDGSATVAVDDTLGSSGTASTGPVLECGNGTLDGEEVCDGDELAGQTCESQGFDGGTLACAADCGAFDESGCVLVNCGDNTIAGREECDGTDLGEATCASQGFDSGPLACDARCLIDTGECGTCGNVIVDGDEVCDDIVLFGQTCESQGFDSGQLACAADCLTYETAGCGTCGNAVIDGAEDCDAAQLGGADCISAGFDSGTLGCENNCSFDSEGCGICGNGVVDGDELCDGLAVPGATCVGQGFDSGLLTCQGSCGAYDTTSCGDCGNGVTDGYEDCDDGNMIDDDACPNDCGGYARTVFVSSVMFTGNLGGLLGADGQCQALANAAGLSGTYMAWLSTAAESPSTRMTQSVEPYVRVDGVEVAPNWAGLVDGTLAAPINVTETGGPAPIGNTSCAGGGFPTVWSATNFNGASGGNACANWTSTMGSGLWGQANATDSTWTSWCSGGLCDWLSPIYCVEQ